MDNETIATALRIAECLSAPDHNVEAEIVGRYVVVRGDRSGVFCGTIVSEDEQTVELTDCRHIWYWSGAANVAEMALRGVSKPADCKFIAPVQRLRVLDAIEVVDCTDTAEESLRAVSEWSKA